MWKTTKGIILKKIQYSEQKYILKIYTSCMGVASFSIKINSGKNNASRRSLLGQSMLMIEFSYLDSNSEIKPIKEINLDCVYCSINNNMIKQSIAIFINEIILQTIKLPMHDKNMYDFLKKTLAYLDETKENLSIFPIWFLLKLTKQLGLEPESPKSSNQLYLDLVSASFSENDKIAGVHLNEELSSFLLNIKNIEYPSQINIKKDSRIKLLDFMIDYFRYHADFNINIKSVSILHTILE